MSATKNICFILFFKPYKHTHLSKIDELQREITIEKQKSIFDIDGTITSKRKHRYFASNRILRSDLDGGQVCLSSGKK